MVYELINDQIKPSDSKSDFTDKICSGSGEKQNFVRRLFLEKLNEQKCKRTLTCIAPSERVVYVVLFLEV